MAVGTAGIDRNEEIALLSPCVFLLVFTIVCTRLWRVSLMVVHCSRSTKLLYVRTGYYWGAGRVIVSSKTISVFRPNR